MKQVQLFSFERKVFDGESLNPGYKAPDFPCVLTSKKVILPVNGGINQ